MASLRPKYHQEKCGESAASGVRNVNCKGAASKIINGAPQESARPYCGMAGHCL